MPRNGNCVKNTSSFMVLKLLHCPHDDPCSGLLGTLNSRYRSIMGTQRVTMILATYRTCVLQGHHEGGLKHVGSRF